MRPHTWQRWWFVQWQSFQWTARADCGGNLCIDVFPDDAYTHLTQVVIRTVTILLMMHTHWLWWCFVKLQPFWWCAHADCSGVSRWCAHWWRFAQWKSFWRHSVKAVAVRTVAVFPSNANAVWQPRLDDLYCDLMIHTLCVHWGDLHYEPYLMNLPYEYEQAVWQSWWVVQRLHNSQTTFLWTFFHVCFNQDCLGTLYCEWLLWPEYDSLCQSVFITVRMWRNHCHWGSDLWPYWAMCSPTLSLPLETH